MLDFILLIPCYNNPLGLDKSLESVKYPNKNFEILIVDDGSIIPLNQTFLNEKYPQFQISVISLKQNSGITKALNTGLENILDCKNTKYIARLDCGDTCSEDRFIKQVDYLNNNQDIYLLGSWCKFVDYKKQSGFIYKAKTKQEDILKEMHLKCSFIHPTVMFKKEVLTEIGFYPYNFPHAEDYAFFWQILKKYKGAIIPEIMVKIELNSKSISSKFYKVQLKKRMEIVFRFGDNYFYKTIGIFMLLLRYAVSGKMVIFFKKRFFGAGNF